MLQADVFSYEDKNELVRLLRKPHTINPNYIYIDLDEIFLYRSLVEKGTVHVIKAN